MLTGISLFSGAVDGLAIAFEMAGIHVTHHVEFDAFCCANLRRLHPHATVIEGDIKDVKELPYADVIFGIFKTFTSVRFSSIINQKKGLIMTRKQQNERASKMYELYLQGYTLEEVGKAWGVSRQSVYEIFKIRGFALREKKALPYIIFQKSKYTLDKDGYYRKTDKPRSFLHQDVWLFHNKEIPEGFDVHHRDEDKTNNDISNLECLSKSEHGLIHTPLQDTPIRHCTFCGKLLVRRLEKNGNLETPSMLLKRKYCNQECRVNDLKGKPKNKKRAI